MLQILVRRKVSTSVVVTTQWQEPILCSSKFLLEVAKTTGAATTTSFTTTTTTTTKRSFAAAAGSKIGRMLDMGGMPSASNDSTMIRAVNASKNCKLQAVAFDFDVLTKSFDESSSSQHQQQQQNNNGNTTTTTPTSNDEKKRIGAIQPDLDKINEVASLLRVKVDGTDDDDDDDRESESSLLASISSSSSLSSSSTTTTTTTEDGNNTVTDGGGSSNHNNVVDNTIPNQDIRAKYAKKLQGGLAGLELAKSQLQNTLKGGDAAGHLAARKIALQESSGSTSSSTKWMALTGTGKLLSYLTHRSIHIALLPNPKLLLHNNNNNDASSSTTTKATIQQRQQQNTQSMKQFSKQLKDVVIDIVVDCQQEKDGDDNDIEQQPTTTKRLLEKRVMNKLDNIIPQQILIVSDSDEYLQAGRDLGMMTCRIRPSNARRGNITTNYTAKSIPDIQEVINEINGISFNAVLNR